MVKIFMLLLFAAFYINSAFSQNNVFRAIVKDSSSQETLIGATALLKGNANGAVADTNGEIAIYNIPNGENTIVFSYTGYHKLELTYNFPLLDSTPIAVLLSTATDEVEEIIVEGTRSNRSIDNIPTRVEVLTEEIDEAATMDPSKIAHLITHSTGIQVQQTSATSNTANVRIQGLDGRYTQILKDGFPLYGGFSGSLSIMQIPPLDLRQVEYIKGGASTLYGGGAISGLINLISKEPNKEETLIHLNASQIGAIDINTYMSRKIGNIGFTLLAQRNSQKYFDADKDGFSDMPQLVKYNFNPKLFFYFSDKTKLSIGGTFTNEIRKGGDIKLLNNETPDSTHFYRETNDISRTTTQLKFEHQLSDKHSIIVRNSFNIFHRALSIIPTANVEEYKFAGRQLSSFSEVAYNFKHKKNVLITGLNFYSDDFREDSLQSETLRYENYKTIGAFANYTFDIGEKVALETGFRGDYVVGGQFFALPRVSALFKWTKKLTTRVGGGLGYRNPTLFNQEAELFGYKNVLSINKNIVKAERSYGGGIDIGYRTAIGENFFININQMFFFTYLNNPIVLSETTTNSGIYNYVNVNGYTRSLGGETFFKFGFYDFVLFVGYTYTNAIKHLGNTDYILPLTPQHSLKGDVLYAVSGKIRAGLDYEFKSSQTLSNGAKTRAFWTYGIVVEYIWKNFTFFGNVENYTNYRQTKFGSLVSAPNGTPQFTEVWAPLDGIVFNYGLKIRL
jgi:outer membrane receptor for ferrienterochelin and colicins